MHVFGVSLILGMYHLSRQCWVNWCVSASYIRPPDLPDLSLIPTLPYRNETTTAGLLGGKPLFLERILRFSGFSEKMYELHWQENRPSKSAVDLRCWLCGFCLAEPEQHLMRRRFQTFRMEKVLAGLLLTPLPLGQTIENSSSA